MRQKLIVTLALASLVSLTGCSSEGSEGAAEDPTEQTSTEPDEGWGQGGQGVRRKIPGFNKDDPLSTVPVVQVGEQVDNFSSFTMTVDSISKTDAIEREHLDPIKAPSGGQLWRVDVTWTNLGNEARFAGTPTGIRYAAYDPDGAQLGQIHEYLPLEGQSFDLQLLKGDTGKQVLLFDSNKFDFAWMLIQESETRSTSVVLRDPSFEDAYKDWAEASFPDHV